MSGFLKLYSQGSDDKNVNKQGTFGELNQSMSVYTETLTPNFYSKPFTVLGTPTGITARKYKVRSAKVITDIIESEIVKKYGKLWLNEWVEFYSLTKTKRQQYF